MKKDFITLLEVNEDAEEVSNVLLSVQEYLIIKNKGEYAYFVAEAICTLDGIVALRKIYKKHLTI